MLRQRQTTIEKSSSFEQKQETKREELVLVRDELDHGQYYF